MARLHGLLDHRHEMLTQLRQINLIAKCGTESRHRASSIILAAIETTIDDGLDAMAQGLEESSNEEGRDHDSDRVILVEHPLEQRLQHKNEAKVKQGEQSSQAAIHKGAVDEHVDVVESIPQDREPNGERDQKYGDPEDESKDHST